jgi:Na+/melibiose symporter-like transporter
MLIEKFNSNFLYGCSHAGKTLIWDFCNKFFLFFLINQYTLDPISAAFIVSALILIDALLDPVTAYIMQYSWLSRLSFRHWVAIFMPICCMSLLALFTLDVSDDKGKLIIYGIIFRVAFTFVDLPLNASIGRFQQRSNTRIFTSAYRSISSTVAAIILSLLTKIYIEEQGQFLASNIAIGAFYVVIIALILVPISFWPVDVLSERKEQIYVKSQAKASDVTYPLGLMKPSKWVTKTYLILVLINIFFLVAVNQFSMAILYIVEMSNDLTLSFSSLWLIMSLISIPSAFMYAHLAKKIGRHLACTISIACIGILAIIFSFTSNSNSLSVLSSTMFFIVFAVCANANLLIWGLFADELDKANEKAGYLIYAFATGIFTFVGKFSISAAFLIQGVILHFSGYPDNVNSNTFYTGISIITVLGVIGAAVCLKWHQAVIRNTVTRKDLQVQSSLPYHGNADNYKKG